jgi:hypothetical protein
VAVGDDLVLTREEARRLAKMGISAFDRALHRGDFGSFARIGHRILINRRQFERVLTGETTSDKTQRGDDA